MDAQDGERLMYCRMAVNGGTLMFADDFPEYTDGISRAPPPDRPTSVTLHLQVEDCDAAYERAITAGASPVMPPADMFWGDRYAQVRDPFGHAWSIGHTLSASA
jgi:PhnB protein